MNSRSHRPKLAGTRTRNCRYVCEIGSIDRLFSSTKGAMSPLGRAKAQPQPLTPPLSDRLEHQYLLPSNSASPYQPSPYEFENIPRVPSHSQTTFSSPDSRQLQIEYGHEPYPKMFHGPKGTYQNTPHGQQDLALEVQYVVILQTNAPAPLFANRQARTSMAFQHRTIQLRMVRIIIPFGNSLLVTASSSLLSRN